MTEKRVVCLNCMDGRVQLPVINWIKENFHVDYVDMITEPGMDGLLANDNDPIDEIIKKINISINKNSASMIFIAGHHDCKGNPVTDQEHKYDINKSVERIKKEISNIESKGLWVDQDWTVKSLD